MHFDLILCEPCFHYAIHAVTGMKVQFMKQRKCVSLCRTKTGKDIFLLGRYHQVTVEQIK